MIDVGHFALALAWLVSFYGVSAALWGALRVNTVFQKSALRASWGVTVLLLIAVSSLSISFLRHDYRYRYVWGHADNNASPWYLLAALWGGMEGSLLFWAALTALFVGLSLLPAHVRRWPSLPWALALGHTAVIVFLSIVLFFFNPFVLLSVATPPLDGQGLNPLLQDPWMVIHPPLLYVGLTTCVVPFSFCLAELISGRLDGYWLKLSRCWLLASWLFLTAGIVIGAYWAYIELGWGGFWAWDPVENASLLPWLTLTALLHTEIVEQQLLRYRLWNVALAIVTYLLSIFATFLTRSGVVQSVHAFSSSKLGWLFLLHLVLLGIISLILMLKRWKRLCSWQSTFHVLSREGILLLACLLLLASLAVTLWGILLPLFSPALLGVRQAVGPSYFNKANAPLFALLLLVLGIGPHAVWNESSTRKLLNSLKLPLLGALIVSAALFYAGVHAIGLLLTCGISFFSILSLLLLLLRLPKGLLKDEKAKLSSAIYPFGVIIVHLGVILMGISIVSTFSLKNEEELLLRPNDAQTIGRYRLRLDGLENKQNNNYHATMARLTVFRADDGKMLGELKPEQRFYFRSAQPSAEVAVRSAFREDLYIAIMSFVCTEDKPTELCGARLRVYVNPLQLWLWIGSALMLLGAILIFVTKRADSSPELS